MEQIDVVEEQVPVEVAEGVIPDMNAPVVSYGKNNAINILISLGAYTLPAYMRGFRGQATRNTHFPHQGEQEMARRVKQMAKGQLKIT